MEALSRIQVLRLGACLAVLGVFWSVWQGAPVAAAYKEAQYTVLQTLNPSTGQSIEIREYAPQLVADVTVSGPRSEAANSGFRQLFAYITGANTSQQSVAMTTPVVEAKSQKIAMTIPVTEKPVIKKGETIAMTTPVVEAKAKTQAQKIAMTTPVTESPSNEGWVTRFFLPSNYTLQTIPTPTNKNVVISQTPAKTMAVIRFSGMGNNESLNKHEMLLRNALAAEGKTVTGLAEYAFYNAPFTLPFLRRNEVMLPL
jgi:hypothetical protein